jgi:hypothetical protein
MDSTIIKAHGAFDGICIDCLDRTKSKTREEDSNYVRHKRKDIIAEYTCEYRITYCTINLDEREEYFWNIYVRLEVPFQYVMRSVEAT